MDKVLVTGGAGFIGSHVCKALANANYIPVTFDNLTRGNSAAVKYGPLEQGDIRDVERVIDVLKRHEPVGIIHMAALAYVRESILEPLLYYDNNVGGSTSLVEAMRRAGIDKIVFSSTCATYGIATDIPITENHPTVPINPYGHSKLMVERILNDANSAHGINSISLRYFNACGSDPDCEIGEWHNPETHIIPLCLMASGGEIEYFQLLGDDHNTPDGTPVRDYIHVSDLAEAHVNALRYILSGGSISILNLGTGKGYSVNEVIQAVERATGRPVPVKILSRHPADPPILVAGGGLANKVIGFQPKHIELDEIVQHAWNWRLKAASEFNSPNKKRVNINRTI